MVVDNYGIEVIDCSPSAGAAFAAGCVLNMDGAAVMDNGSGVYTESIMAD